MDRTAGIVGHGVVLLLGLNTQSLPAPGERRLLHNFQQRTGHTLNDDPKPFVWTRSADKIFAKLEQLPVPSQLISAFPVNKAQRVDPVGFSGVAK